MVVDQFYLQHHRHPSIAVDGTMWIVEMEKATTYFKISLFNRLLLFYCLGLQIVVVFDGTNKLPKSNRNNEVINYMGKATSEIKAFCELMGVSTLIAPSEGEAVCAKLQRDKMVDFAFTGDSDSLVYGATKIIRYMKSERIIAKDTAPQKRSSSFKQGGSTMDTDQQVYNDKALTPDKLVAVVDISDAVLTESLHPDTYIVLALLTGGDHDSGVARVGPAHARRICTPASKFATPLLEIFRKNKRRVSSGDNGNTKVLFTLDAEEQYELETLLEWLFEELKNDPEKKGRKMGKNLSSTSLKGFPDHKVLHYYLYSFDSARPLIVAQNDLAHKPPDIHAIWTCARKKHNLWPVKDVTSFISQILLTWCLSPVGHDHHVLDETMAIIAGIRKTKKDYKNLALPVRYKVKLNHFQLIKAFLSKINQAKIELQGIDSLMDDMMVPQGAAIDSLIELTVPENVLFQCAFGERLVNDYLLSQKIKAGIAQRHKSASGMPSGTERKQSKVSATVSQRSQSLISNFFSKSATGVEHDCDVSVKGALPVNEGDEEGNSTSILEALFEDSPPFEPVSPLFLPVDVTELSRLSDTKKESDIKIDSETDEEIEAVPVASIKRRLPITPLRKLGSSSGTPQMLVTPFATKDLFGSDNLQTACLSDAIQYSENAQSDKLSLLIPATEIRQAMPSKKPRAQSFTVGQKQSTFTLTTGKPATLSFTEQPGCAGAISSRSSSSSRSNSGVSSTESAQDTAHRGSASRTKSKRTRSTSALPKQNNTLDRYFSVTAVSSTSIAGFSRTPPAAASTKSALITQASAVGPSLAICPSTASKLNKSFSTGHESLVVKNAPLYLASDLIGCKSQATSLAQRSKKKQDVDPEFESHLEQLSKNLMRPQQKRAVREASLSKIIDAETQSSDLPAAPEKSKASPKIKPRSSRLAIDSMFSDDDD